MHHCQVCSKEYARYDHLTRHMKSHLGKRPHRCPECGKSFTRSDLLSRHRGVHERRMNSSTRTNRHSERPMRSLRACRGCASSKTRCDDIKPCQRCTDRGMICKTSKGDVYGLHPDGDLGNEGTDDENLPSSQNAPQNIDATESRRLQTSSSPGFLGTVNPDPFQQSMYSQPNELNLPFLGLFDQLHSDSGLLGDHNFSDESLWNAEFQALMENTSPSEVRPHGLETTSAVIGCYTASKKSPWVWQPHRHENTYAENASFTISDSTIGSSPEASEALSCSYHISLSPTVRDRILGLVIESLKLSATSISSFPSTVALDYLVQIFFHSQKDVVDKWIHKSSFDSADVSVELLMAMAAAGAQVVAKPAVWKMGFALQEAVRLSSMALVEADNSNSRNLSFIQTVRLCVDIGIWSGSMRKIEIAEGIEQAVITMLRRTGTFDECFYSTIELHQQEDEEAVRIKWRKWAYQEAVKRTTLHSFIHDMQSSIALRRGPLTTLVEYTLPVPAAEALWEAASSKEWEDLYTSFRRPRPLPSIASSHQDIGLDSDMIDVNLTNIVLLYGFWPQIWALGNAKTLHKRRKDSRPVSDSSDLWIACQYENIYNDLQRSQRRFLSTQCNVRDEGVLISELLMMLLHMPDVDLQCLAGKSGFREVGKTFLRLREDWFSTREARCAVWHAGQVFRAARSLQARLIRGFYATAVYQAALCLWAYGIVQDDQNNNQTAGTEIVMPLDCSPVVLDSSVTASRMAFIDFAEGLPVLTGVPSTSWTYVFLTNQKQVMEIAREILWNRFSVDLAHYSSAAPSPLVMHLDSIMKDLGEVTAILRQDQY